MLKNLEFMYKIIKRKYTFHIIAQTKIPYNKLLKTYACGMTWNLLQKFKPKFKTKSGYWLPNILYMK